MKWFLIFNPFACLKLLLLAICVFTIGYVLAINVLIMKIGDANGSRHTITSDPEHVYSVPLGDQEKTGAIPTSHRMSPASLVAEATASRAIPRSKHGLDLA
jgi:hypothetical protein